MASLKSMTLAAGRGTKNAATATVNADLAAPFKALGRKVSSAKHNERARRVERSKANPETPYCHSTQA